MTGQQVRIVADGSIWHVVGVIDGIATLRHPTERHDCPGPSTASPAKYSHHTRN